MGTCGKKKSNLHYTRKRLEERTHKTEANSLLNRLACTTNESQERQRHVQLEGRGVCSPNKFGCRDALKQVLNFILYFVQFLSHIGRDLGFSSTTGRIPPRSGWLDSLGSRNRSIGYKYSCSLRSWRYCEIKVLAAEPQSQKRSGDEAFEIPPARKPRYFE